MSSHPPIRLLLADDHAVVRMGLAAMLSVEGDFEIVAEAEDGEEAVILYRQHRPDVALFDVRMPGIGGVEALRRVHAEFPEARILMLSTAELEEDVAHSAEAGAGGYALKTLSRTELVAAIRRVSQGERYFSPEMDRRLAERTHGRQLSPREHEVLELMRRGLSNKDISVALGISEHTVKTHVKAILEKLHAADRAEAVAAAFERGVLTLG